MFGSVAALLPTSQNNCCSRIPQPRGSSRSLNTHSKHMLVPTAYSLQSVTAATFTVITALPAAAAAACLDVAQVTAAAAAVEGSAAATFQLAIDCNDLPDPVAAAQQK